MAEDWYQRAKKPHDGPERRTIKVRFNDEEMSLLQSALRPGECLSVFLRALALGYYEEPAPTSGTNGGREGEENQAGE